MSKVGLLLGYKHFFNDTPPGNRLDLIRNISKIDLIGEFAASNYRLKLPLKIFFEYPVEDQLSEIVHSLRLYPDLKAFVFNKFIYLLKYSSTNSLIFNRAGFLFALNEIISCGELSDIDNFQFSAYDQENIFKYLLLVNEAVTDYNEEIFNVTSYTQIENFNFASLALNEYFIPFDPLFTLHIGGQLYNYLSSSEYREPLHNYLINSLGVAPNNFIYEIANMLMTKHMPDRNWNFFYNLNRNDSRLSMFNYFSRRNIATSTNDFEFIEIRKSPFFKQREETFLLLDNMFLLSKCYYFFIWDFLYESLLNGITNNRERVSIIKSFKGKVGLFFENYIKDILKESFVNNTYKVRLFEQLKRKIDRSEIELADIYIKTKNKIIIGQAKTTSVINKEKYAEDVDNFYAGNPDDFFKKHGMFQLVQSIKDILQYGKLIDKSIPKKRIKIFPIIVFNDLLLNNFLFPQVFNEKFNELITGIEDECVKIYPLTLIHVSDLEVLEKSLSEKKVDLFELLKEHSRKSTIQMPFYLTANQHRRRHYPERVLQYFRNIIRESGADGN